MIISRKVVFFLVFSLFLSVSQPRTCFAASWDPVSDNKSIMSGYSKVAKNTVLVLDEKKGGEKNKNQSPQYSSMCLDPEIRIFSCRLNSGKIVNLCLSKKTLNMRFRFTDKDGQKSEISVEDPRQLSGSASSGPTTILQSQSKDEPVILFLDMNTAENEGTAISRGHNKNTEFCVNSTIDAPVDNWAPTGVVGGTSIWSLLFEGISKPFSSGPNGETDPTNAWWRSWPHPK